MKTDLSKLKVAVVHDYLNEFGGAEQVLLALTKLFPQAPIYTAFKVPGSSAEKAFKDKKIIPSWFQRVPGFAKLYSPLRFVIPWIWNRWDLSEYEVIITSASWYVTKGLVKNSNQVEICYCHTPPRWLYGYSTSVNLQKYLPVRIYAAVVGHFLRMYDFKQAQKVTQFVANSKNVAERIWKHYRRKSEVVYPPVELPTGIKTQPGDYYLMVTRIVGGKGIELGCAAAEKAGFKLKIAGEMKGFKSIDFSQYKQVEYLGRVNGETKWQLMAQARGFLALSKDEDFGITCVEAQAAGTPVIAFKGGGYPETVIDGETGVLFGEYSTEGVIAAIKRSEKIKFDPEKLKKQASNFSPEKFKTKMLRLVESYARVTGN